MDKSQIIQYLSKSPLYAECSKCGEEFKLSEAIIFDGLGELPDIADARRKQLFEDLEERMDDLKKRKLRADVGTEKKVIEVGFGKIIEKIVPAHKDFKPLLSDCRPLFEPIDMIIFNGCTDFKINSVTFLEIKTGEAKANPHEKMIKKAIEQKHVSYKVF